MHLEDNVDFDAVDWSGLARMTRQEAEGLAPGRRRDTEHRTPRWPTNYWLEPANCAKIRFTGFRLCEALRQSVRIHVFEKIAATAGPRAPSFSLILKFRQTLKLARSAHAYVRGQHREVQ